MRHNPPDRLKLLGLLTNGVARQPGSLARHQSNQSYQKNVSMELEFFHARNRVRDPLNGYDAPENITRVGTQSCGIFQRSPRFLPGRQAQVTSRKLQLHKTPQTEAAVKRLVACESATKKGAHRVTVFIDLSTFYESVSLKELEASAEALSFPPLLLFNALRSYLGARVLTCEEVVSPALFARRGLLAGCPLAPMLSKIALYSPLSAVLNGRRSIAGADVWIDDISVDLEDQSAEKAAGNARLLYKQLSQALGGGGHSVSTKKTLSRASKALSGILEDGDPEVRSIGKDLGVGASGAKRCRHQKT